MNLERAEMHSDGNSLHIGLPTNGENTDGFGWIEEYKKGSLIFNIKYTGTDRITACGFYEENAMFFDGIKKGTLDSSALSGAMNSMLVKGAYAKGVNVYEDTDGTELLTVGG